MQTLLNGVTTTTTSSKKTINGVNTIVCKGLKGYKQFIDFYISVDNVHFVLFKKVILGDEVFSFNTGNCHIYCKFETELENNDPIYVNMT